MTTLAEAMQGLQIVLRDLYLAERAAVRCEPHSLRWVKGLAAAIVFIRQVRGLQSP